MIWKLTILLWVLALVARYIVKITASREDKIAATLFGKARITPFRVLTVMLMFSWYGSKGQVVSDTVRKGTAQCVIRIPYTAIVEGGKQYISEEEYKKLSDEDAERYWTIQKNAYIVRGQLEVADQWVFDTFSFQHGVILKETIEDLAKLRQHDEDFVTITEYADNTLRGTDRTKHWRIGGA